VMSNELGFSVACHLGDVPLLRGCLASIKYFAPDAPICLIIDGDFDTRPFEKRYGVLSIRKRDVRHPELRRLSFGYGVTKMPVLWEGPFERVLHVDADAVLWGDIRKNLPSDDWDFVHNEPHEVITDYLQRTQYFDPKKIFNYIDYFDWQGKPYFNSGIFACKKGCLDLGEYLKMLRLQEQNMGLFFQDQAYLNIMVFRACNAGLLKRRMVHLQTCVPATENDYLARRFTLLNQIPLLNEQPSVVHWAGPKPYKTNPDVFSLPMDYFREIGLREFGLPKWFPADWAMRLDEFQCRDVPRAVASFKFAVKKAIGRK
jgi:hypothetical protein